MSRNKKSSNTSTNPNDVLTIKQVEAEYGITAIYIRKAMKEGKLTGEKVAVKEGSATMKNVFTREAVEAWRAASGSHTRRADGRNKFVLYANPDELAKVQSMIDSGELTAIVERANKAKAELAIEAE
jgi:hypothetical protein